MPKVYAKRIVIVVQRGQRKKSRTAAHSRLGDRLGLAMATARTKFQFTDYQMFAALVSVAGDVSPEVIKSALGDNYDPEKHTPENLARKVSHKFHVLKENAAKPKAPSKTALENRATAEKLAAAHADGEPFTLAEVMAEFPSVVTSAPKAAKIVGLLMLDKRATKVAPIGNKMAYAIVA